MNLAAELGIAPPKPIFGHKPITFLERGVSVPYTTPALAAARVRPAKRERVELVVPNPSGGRGVYLFSLDGAFSVCRPTLHDRALNDRMLALLSITPETIRGVALQVAKSGLAGPGGARTAVAQLADDRQQSTLAHLELILEVVRQMEQHRPGRVAPELTDMRDLQLRARAALMSLSVRTRRSGEEMMAMLEDMAQVFRAVGVGRQAERAWVAQWLALLGALRRDLAKLAPGLPREAAAVVAIIDATADLTVRAADITLAAARRLLADMPSLLVRWTHDPESVAKVAARPEWLLDGWQRIVSLWNVPDDRHDRTAMLLEMLELVPVMPEEVSDWVGIELHQEAETLSRRRIVRLGQDWRTGEMVIDVQARNERLRAYTPWSAV